MNRCGSFLHFIPRVAAACAELTAHQFHTAHNAPSTAPTRQINPQQKPGRTLLGTTPLHAAVWRERFLVVELLLQKGANACAADHDGNTQLHGVAQTGQEGTAWLLVGADADVNAKNRFGETPFYLTLKCHNNGMVPALRGSGAGINQFSPDVFRTAAVAGDAAAMTSLGSCYELGGMAGVKQDHSKAMEWYLKAAAAGDADAMCRIGTLNRSGCGVSKDDAKAMDWYQTAARAGNAGAMVEIGNLYANDHGIPQDFTKAMDGCRKAAAAGTHPSPVEFIHRRIQIVFIESLAGLRKPASGGQQRAPGVIRQGQFGAGE